MSVTSRKKKIRRRERFHNNSERPCRTCPVSAICLGRPERMKGGRRCVECATDFVTFFPLSPHERAHIWDYKIDHDSCPMIQNKIEHFNDIPPELDKWSRDNREDKDWREEMLCEDCKIHADNKKRVERLREIPVGYRWRNRRKKLPKGRPREK